MRFTTLTQWLDWQSSLHPSEIELGLERVADVWHRLSPVGLASPVVSVAGTNGKGSCVALLEAIYRQAGYRVASYTSPHLVRYNERIKLDGVEIDDRRLCAAFDAVDSARGDITLTYFEFGTLAALYLFAQRAPDLVILEVGLGGRLDAVNIIDADLAIITSIDLDHQDWLGETREAIAQEKAGIMRPRRPAVLADPAMPDTLFEAAARCGAQVWAAGRDYLWNETPQGWRWSVPTGVSFDLPLPGISGTGRFLNAAAVVMACQCLQGRLPVPESALARGLAKAHLSGRLQLLPGRPARLLDVAHNRQAVAGLLSSLERIAPGARVLAIFGSLKDKDVAAIARLLHERIDQWHLMDLSGGRGRSSRALAQALQAAGIRSPIHAWPDFANAYQAAESAAREQDLILIFGSFQVVGEAMHYLDI